MYHLINNDGAPFESTDLQALHKELDALDDDGRTKLFERPLTTVINKN